MSNNTNHDSNTDISKNQEPTTHEIRRVLKPLFDEFTQVLQQHGLKDVEVVDFTTCISSKVVREATDSSKTMLDEYNDILRKTGFSDVYKNLEIIAFTIAATSKRNEAFNEGFNKAFNEDFNKAFAEIGDDRRVPIPKIKPITNERENGIIALLKARNTEACRCKNPEGECTSCRGAV